MAVHIKYVLLVVQLLGVHEPVSDAVDPDQKSNTGEYGDSCTDTDQNHMHASHCPNRIGEVAQQAAQTNSEGEYRDPAAIGLDTNEYDGNSAQQEGNAECTGNAVDCGIGIQSGVTELGAQVFGDSGVAVGENHILEDGDGTSISLGNLFSSLLCDLVDSGLVGSPVGQEVSYDKCQAEHSTDN